MNIEFLPDSRHYADELLALRRDNAALKVALADSQAANKSLRLENAELRFTMSKAARRIEEVKQEISDRFRRAIASEVLK